jgi:bifunctional DNA-binding transcriptional regulator/antitoxin component of YhaV-PrlF toxin-antitoxin module
VRARNDNTFLDSAASPAVVLETFRITGVTRTGPGGQDVTLSFTTLAGAAYRVQQSSSLAAGSWIETGVSATGTGTVQNLTMPAVVTGALPGVTSVWCGSEAEFAKRNSRGSIGPMTATLTLDEAGRLVLPDAALLLLGMKPGERLRADVTPNRIEILPAAAAGTDDQRELFARRFTPLATVPDRNLGEVVSENRGER